MAINIKFDLAGNPEPPTILLANRNGNILGQLGVDEESIDLSDKFNDTSEFTFTIYKNKLDFSDSERVIYNEFLKSSDDYILKDSNGLFLITKDSNRFVVSKEAFESYLWDKVVDFKLVYCKEWDTWFEIKVELDESTETIKTVFCTQLEKAELSQLNLYNIEINTEADIERDDYKICILYDENDKDASILNRLLKDKAPHYSIAHVDSTIAKIQRSFSFDGTSIDDAFQEIAEEIGCVFIYHSYLDEDRILRRTISVYDLQQTCNDCGYRGEFTDKCPKCNSTNITNGYGEDTLIFVTSDELASDGIELVTDTDRVKNCFKLETGDDLMTATVRNCNPNGTDYIWYFSDAMKEDMSDELVEKLESYNKLYKYHYNDSEYNVNSDLLSKFNNLVDKYSTYNEDLQKIETPIKGYSSLMNAYYNTIDLGLYLKSSLMPNVEMSKTTAQEQANLLTSSSLSPVAVADVTIVSLATANSAVLAMAKITVKSTYKVQIKDSEIYDQGNGKYWSGNFVVTNYSDEEDTSTSNVVTIAISDDLETSIKQQIDKALNKENTDDLSITGLFEKEYDEFCAELKKYALNPLISFHDACQSCINILIEQGVGSDSTSTEDVDLYNNLYVPYYNKLMAIESEMKIREDEINVITGIYDLDGNLTTDGLQTNIEKCQIEIKNTLDFKKYLGEKLWLEFCAYRRDDTYSNDNYISDGLNNAELFKRAFEFFEVAENEIFKASELQHSISTTLNNLLAIDKFKPLVNSFKVGNWIRVQVDDRIFKLRLLSYDISYGNFETIPVEFSDVAKIKNGITDVQSTLKQASSMSTSYSSVKRQAKQGEKSNSVLNNWVENGLSATNTKIISADEQNQVWDKKGMLFRQYDPITNTYGDEQLRIINSTIAITDDNWKTTKTAIGKYFYIDPHTGELKTAYGVNGETIVGKLLIGKQLDISNESGNLGFGVDGLVVKNDMNTITMNPSDESIINIKNNSGNIFSLNEKGELVIIGNITASSLTLLDGASIEGNNITGLSDVAISGDYNDLLNKPTKLSDFQNDKSFITNDTNNLTYYYKKTEVENLLDSKVNSDDLTNINNLSNYYNKTQVNNLLNSKVDSNSLSDIATSGSYNDLIDIEELKDWVLEQISMATN